MEGFPGWGISSVPGPPPRLHEHVGRYTPSTQPLIPTRWIWKDDYDGRMIFEGLMDLKLLTFVLQVRKNTEKIFTQKTCPDRGSNQGPLRYRRACYRLLHSGGQLSYTKYEMDVHRCGTGGRICACHAAGPDSIPGRDKFPGWGFFRVSSSPVRQISGSFRPPNIIWPSSIIIHYGRQWPEMLTRPKTSNMHRLYIRNW